MPLTTAEGTLRLVMGRPRGKAPRRHETILQTVFVKRVREELNERQLSENDLSKRPGGPAQKTLSDVLNAGVVPRLTTVYEIASALGVHPWELMQEKPKANPALPMAKVTQIRPAPDKLLTRAQNRTPGQTTKRNKART